MTTLEAARNRLTKQVEDLETSIRQKDDLIASLTPKGDSLGRQFLQMKQTKENLENVVRAIAGLSTKIEEEKVQGGMETARISIYLKDILMGSLVYVLPERMSPNEEKAAEAVFSTESIDSVRVSRLPPEAPHYGFLVDKWVYRIIFQAAARHYFDQDLPVFENILQSFPLTGTRA